MEIRAVKSTGEVMGVLPQRCASKNYSNNVKQWVLLMPSGLDWALMWWYQDVQSIHPGAPWTGRGSTHAAPALACLTMGAGSTLMVWSAQGVWFIILLQLQWSNVGLPFRCPLTAAGTWSACRIILFPGSWSPTLLPLHSPFSTLVSSWRSNLPLITFPTLVLVLLYLYPNLVFLIPLPRWPWPFMETLIRITMVMCWLCEIILPKMPLLLPSSSAVLCEVHL